MDQGKIIATGSPAEIIQSLGADSVIELELPDLGSHVTYTEKISAVDGVVKLRTDESRWVLTVRDVHSTLPKILQVLHSQQAELTDLRTHRPNLEDVFVSLTGRQLRDE